MMISPRTAPSELYRFQAVQNGFRFLIQQKDNHGKGILCLPPSHNRVLDIQVPILCYSLVVAFWRLIVSLRTEC